MAGVNMDNIDPLLHDMLKKIKDDSDNELITKPHNNKTKKNKTNTKNM